MEPVDDLPVLGEVFAVELANTHHPGHDDHPDVLGDDAVAVRWLHAAPAAVDLPTPGSMPSGARCGLQRVRDATRLLIDPIADRTPTLGADEAVATLNRAAALADAAIVLDRPDQGGPTWRIEHAGAPADVLVAAAATRCIQFLGGPELPRIRRCARPQCPMLFVARHRSRRFCHDTCSHATRQARYYRSVVRPRRTGGPGSPGPTPAPEDT